MGLKSSLPLLLIALLAIPIFLFTLFPLISSTATSLNNIYLLSLIWSSPGNGQPDVLLRIGYYGLCWKNFPSPPHDPCIGSSVRSANSIVSSIFGPNPDDVKNTTAYVQLALDLQRKVFVAFLTAGGLAWLISLVLALLVAVAKGGAGKSWRVVSTWMACVAAILMIASAWATTAAIRALEVASGSYGGFNQSEPVGGGNLLIGLQWTGAVLSVVHAWAVSRVAASGEKETVYSYNMGR